MQFEARKSILTLVVTSNATTFLDALTKEFLYDPVTLPSGNIVNRSTAVYLLGVDPFSSQSYQVENLVCNKEIKDSNMAIYKSYFGALYNYFSASFSEPNCNKDLVVTWLNIIELVEKSKEIIPTLIDQFNILKTVFYQVINCIPNEAARDKFLEIIFLYEQDPKKPTFKHFLVLFRPNFEICLATWFYVSKTPNEEDIKKYFDRFPQTYGMIFSHCFLFMICYPGQLKEEQLQAKGDNGFKAIKLASNEPYLNSLVPNESFIKFEQSDPNVELETFIKDSVTDKKISIKVPIKYFAPTKNGLSHSPCYYCTNASCEKYETCALHHFLPQYFIDYPNSIFPRHLYMIHSLNLQQINSSSEFADYQPPIPLIIGVPDNFLTFPLPNSQEKLITTWFTIDKPKVQIDIPHRYFAPTIPGKEAKNNAYCIKPACTRFEKCIFHHLLPKYFLENSGTKVPIHDYILKFLEKYHKPEVTPAPTLVATPAPKLSNWMPDKYFKTIDLRGLFTLEPVLRNPEAISIFHDNEILSKIQHGWTRNSRRYSDCIDDMLYRGCLSFVGTSNQFLASRAYRLDSSNGSIFLGIKSDNSFELAIKQYKLFLEDQESVLKIKKQFENEDHILKLCSSVPGIPRYYGSDMKMITDKDGTTISYFVALELMESSLREILDEWKKSNPDGQERLYACQYVIGSIITILNDMILSRPTGIPDQVIIHRNLKPEIIMFDSLFRVRLIDFGTAKISQDGKTLEASIGTKSVYTSPEQFDGRLSILSDLFPIGLITSEILIGTKIWEVGGSSALQSKILDPTSYECIPKPHQRAAALDFIKRLLNLDYHLREFPNPFVDYNRATRNHEALLLHPFFWDDNRCLTLLSVIGNLKIPHSIEIKVIKECITKAFVATGMAPKSSWKHLVPQNLYEQSKTEWKRDETKLKDPFFFLRFIRNSIFHEFDQTNLGQNDIWFLFKVPTLVVELWNGIMWKLPHFARHPSLSSIFFQKYHPSPIISIS